MSVAQLQTALAAVPYFAHLGIRAEEARPGQVVLRLPHRDEVTNHAGALHSSAVFAVAELCAAVALGTHPSLTDLMHLQKSAKIKYYLPSSRDVTAHATITEEMLQAIRDGLGVANAHVEVPVKVFDGHGEDVAELVAHFAFRQR